VGARPASPPRTNWAGEVFVLWVCLAAFTRHTPSVEAVVVGYATGYALTRRTLPLAGAGAVEALLPFALSWCGIPLAAAVLAPAGNCLPTTPAKIRSVACPSTLGPITENTTLITPSTMTRTGASAGTRIRRRPVFLDRVV